MVMPDLTPQPDEFPIEQHCETPQLCVPPLPVENLRANRISRCAGPGETAFYHCGQYPQVLCEKCDMAFCARCDAEFHFGKDPIAHVRRYTDNSQKSSLRPCVFAEHPRHRCQFMGNMNCRNCVFTTAVCMAHIEKVHQMLPHAAEEHFIYPVEDRDLFPSRGNRSCSFVAAIFSERVIILDSSTIAVSGVSWDTIEAEGDGNME